MLRPDAVPIVLLPQERALIQTLGISETEYRWFVRETLKKSRIQPSGPQAFLVIPFLIQLAIGAIISIGAAYLFSRNQSNQSAGSSEIRQTRQQGETITNASEFAPKAGFDALQRVVELGSTIPLVYARRRNAQGGVRINTPLLWSQLWSLGGSQLLRAIFSLGEGPIAELDPNGFAIGDNTVNNFSFLNSAAAGESAKLTIYLNPEGGRLKGESYVGRKAANDPGNAETAGASDIFQVRTDSNTYEPWFSNVKIPSTTRDFGVYTLIPNDFGYRVNPQFSPNYSFELRTTTDAPENLQQAAERRGAAVPDPGGTSRLWKNGWMFSGRSGITSTSTGSTSLKEGDTFTYVLNASSDKNSEFVASNKEGTNNEAIAECGDVASGVASRQNVADDALSIGNVFKAGSCLAVLETRSPEDEIFQSSDGVTGSGQTMTYTFRVIRAGQVTLISQNDLAPGTQRVEIGTGYPNSDNVSGEPRYGVASTRAQIFQFSIGGFTIDRPSRIIELGLRSRLGITVGGICNFRSTPNQYRINLQAGLALDRTFFATATQINLINFTSGQVSTPLIRYSFFRVSYRPEEQTTWTDFPEIFGVRSLTRENVFNYMRFVMPTVKRWEFRIEPVTAWELRNVITTPEVNILDNRLAGIESATAQGVTISWSGTKIARAASSFRHPEIEPSEDLGIGFTEGTSMYDEWAAVAEAFCYGEITTTASGSPEHSIAYVNTLIPNDPVPQYTSMATVGFNLFATNEFTQLEQFSSYVLGGIKVRRFVEGDVGPSNNFADILYDLLTNTTYGAGKILSPSMIDTDSFAKAAAWCEARGYAWDGAITTQLNIRSWAAQTASYFLLDFLIANGRFALAPAAPFNTPVEVSALFTSGNILEDSFTFGYLDQTSRQAVQVSVKWREERISTQEGSKGLFPVLREVLVREAGTEAGAPLETIDLSDFCTSQAHAIDVAKYLIRSKRLTTSRVSFKTTPSEVPLRPGAVFKLGLETVTYNQPNNGFILGDGSVDSFTPTPDGTYEVAYWDGKSADIRETTTTITNGFSNNLKNCVFCIQSATVTAPTYKVQSLAFDEDGNIEVEANLYPTDEAGYSLLTQNWDTGWEIID